MNTHTQTDYQRRPTESPYDAAAIPSGMPSLASTAILPQYSHTGRMEPEFNPGEDYPDDADTTSAIALGRIIKVLGYEPREGTGGTRIAVRVQFRRNRLPPQKLLRLRVKMGNIPLRTVIKGIRSADGVEGEWRLHLVAPDPRELNVVGLEVPLIVQAWNEHDSTIIDDVCIGSFKFWNLTPAEESYTSGASYFVSEMQEYSSDEYSASRPSYSRNASFGERNPSAYGDEPSLPALYPSETSTSALGLINTTEAAPGGSLHEQARLAIEVSPHNTVEISNTDGDIESPSTARSFPAQQSGEDTYQVSLQFIGDLDSMIDNWTTEELRNQRRIVEFFCVRTRGRIDVTFAPISVEDARDSRKNIVSCIWWKDAEEFVITSVDTINLLERLVGTKFTTEEKNRIRRNLQGFKPSTVSKNSPESEAFFRTLMEFPPPRPRNIEKDVKAFRWSKLPSMLEKVISKYWFVSSPSGSEEDESSPRVRVLREIDGASTESPGMSLQSLSTSHTPTSVPSSRLEVEQTRSGVLESISYIPSSSSGQSRPEEYLSGFPADGRHLGYVQPSQSSAHSSYGHPEALMEISEVSMEELHSVPMGASQVLSRYEHMETYPEAHNPEGTYLHQGNINEMANEGVHHMQYMAHTSHEYA